MNCILCLKYRVPVEAIVFGGPPHFNIGPAVFVLKVIPVFFGFCLGLIIRVRLRVGRFLKDLRL